MKCTEKQLIIAYEMGATQGLVTAIDEMKKSIKEKKEEILKNKKKSSKYKEGAIYGLEYVESLGVLISHFAKQRIKK